MSKARSYHEDALEIAGKTASKSKSYHEDATKIAGKITSKPKKSGKHEKLK